MYCYGLFTESRRSGSTCPESIEAVSGAGVGAGTGVGAGAVSASESAERPEEAVLAALRRQLQPHLLAALHAHNNRPHRQQVNIISTVDCVNLLS